MANVAPHADKEWMCKSCTFMNDKPHGLTCEVCLAKRYVTVSSDTGTWSAARRGAASVSLCERLSHVDASATASLETTAWACQAPPPCVVLAQWA